MNPWCPGYFLNEAEGDGWEARLSKVEHGHLFKWREKQTFKFTLSRLSPVTFYQDDGTLIMPCLPGESFPFDFGSIPPIAQAFIVKEGVWYAFHDRAYAVGWLWVNAFNENIWRPVRLSRGEADALLYTQLRCAADPRGRCKAGLIYGAVAAFGRFCGYTSAASLPAPVHIEAPPQPDHEEGD